MVKSGYFDGFMFLVLTLNCAIIIASAIVTDEDALLILDSIDDYILYVYILECILKIIGLGVEKYWEDSWN